MDSPRENLDPTDQGYAAADLVTQLDEYIVMRVTQEMIHNPAFAHSPTLGLEIDDVAQQIRIKLWHVAQKQVLRSPKAYIDRMVTTTLIDLFRSREPTLRLFVDEEGEPYEGFPIIEPGEGMDDPSYETAQETGIREVLTAVIDALPTFPPRQRFALLCALSERIDDRLLLETLLQRRGLRLTDFTWPEDLAQRQRLLASLPLARKRLRLILDSSSSHTEEQSREVESRDTPQPEITTHPQLEQNGIHVQDTRIRPAKRPPEKEAPLMKRGTPVLLAVDIAKLEALPERSREAIRLRYIEHLSYEQMVSLLQVPQGTLRSQISRGMKQLRSAHAQTQTGSQQPSSADIKAALEHLREPYRTAIELHYLEHLTYHKMAQLLHCPLGTIKSLVSRANKLMRQHLSSSTPAAKEPAS